MPRTDRQLDKEPPDRSDERQRSRERGKKDPPGDGEKEQDDEGRAS